MNILDTKVSIHQSTLLEASAGTGKTFAIENLVVRLLLEEDPLPIESILAVTFTRAAARDLKFRIRASLAAKLEAVENGRFEDLPDYMADYNTPEGLRFARRCLEHALFCFDRAQIFTIHGFCLRMLKEHLFEADFCPDPGSKDDAGDKLELLKTLRDYFRSEVRSPFYSAAELDLVIGHFGNSIQGLEKALMHTLSQSTAVINVASYETRKRMFERACSDNKEQFLSLLNRISLNYKGLHNRKKEMKSDVAKLFDTVAKAVGEKDYELFLLNFDKLYSLFTLKNLRSDAIEPVENQKLKALYPLADPMVPFCRMAEGAKQLLKKRVAVQERLSCDDLLGAMRQALSHAPFLRAVQKRFKAAVIDEFQDTDPIQWEIFETLFADSSSHLLYLVGDPKQSIYAFRQADIYTYGKAFAKMERHATLDRNYRSQESVVVGLNALFSRAEQFFPLPKENSHLPFFPVKPSNRIVPKVFTDGKGSIHFWIVEQKLSLTDLEENYFFPLISNEIQKLGAPYSQCAVLVSDRWQGEKLTKYLQKLEIPFISQRAENLVESHAFSALKEVLIGVIDSYDHSCIKRALATEIFGWTDKDLALLEDPLELEKIVFAFQHFRTILQQEGFVAFYQMLLQTRLDPKENCVAEAILLREEGHAFFQDMQQIAEILFDQAVSPEGLVVLLDDFPLLAMDDDPRLKKRPVADEDAVQILTTHASKGLEFSYVFCLGLVKRNPEPDLLIPQDIEGERVLAPAKKDSESYKQYCAELDAEKMRQLYVAMTRAKYRVFCPVWQQKSPAQEGCSSPMELFLQKCNLQEAAAYCPEVTYENIASNPLLAKRSCKQSAFKLIQPKSIKLKFAKQQITSFSQMALKAPSSLQQPPHDFSAANKTPHTLPAGSDTGTLLHKILETIPFTLSTLDEVIAFVDPFVSNTPYQEWKHVIGQMIFQALRSELNDFCLQDINPVKVVRETTFLVDGQQDMIKGVIDLVFEHEGKYYLLDWKTNWLGDKKASYGQADLEHAMASHDYLLQAKIYSEALFRWISLYDKRPFTELFGGVFYIFMRGMEYGIWKKLNFFEINCCEKKQD